MTGKKWYKSKTHWFNILSGLVLMLPEIGALLNAWPRENATIEQMRLWYPAVVILGNIWLRSITKEPVTL